MWVEPAGESSLDSSCIPENANETGWIRQPPPPAFLQLLSCSSHPTPPPKHLPGEAPVKPHMTIYSSAHKVFVHLSLLSVCVHKNLEFMQRMFLGGGLVGYPTC